MRFTPQQWQQIEALFHQALDQEPCRQVEFVRTRCGNDTTVCMEVERLLHHHRDVGDSFDPPTELLAHQARQFEGRQVGNFRLVRLIASGGMGTVWLGERADATYCQCVAVKLMTTGILRRDLLRYYEREQRALAQLEHPFITRLIDGGTTDEGWPYLVMEYVQGKPIDVYCDENRLRISERLKLFCKVCEAVHFAHQRLIVHRDLKPNNILVMEDGRPKLLDFGISKLLDAPIRGANQDATQTLLRVMTPQYASPEQMRGDVITTATDIYSLGVILYELLSGHRPYVRNDQSDAQWERIVCDTEPAAPSSVVERADSFAMRLSSVRKPSPRLVGELRRETTRVLRRRLHADLDNVVLTALQRDPSRRYNSVLELSDDIQRHLAGLPVRARAGSLTYRSVKFMKRHRKMVAASVVLVLSLLVGIAGTSMGMHRARQERDIALKVTEFLERVFLLTTPYGDGENRSGVGLLQAAAARVGDELDDEPALAARLYTSLAQTHARMWLWGEAADLAQKALDINRQLYGGGHPAFAESALLVGRTLAQISNADAPEASARAYALHAEMYGEQDWRTAVAQDELALALWKASVPSQWDRAEDLHRRAIITLRSFSDSHPYELATALADLAVMMVARRDQTDECESLYQESQAFFMADGAPLSRAAAEYKRSFLPFYQRNGRLDDLAMELQSYLEMTPVFFEHTAPVVGARWWLADIERLRGNFESALVHYRQALTSECWKRRMGETEATATFRMLHSSFQNDMQLGEMVPLLKRLIGALQVSTDDADRILGYRLVGIASLVCGTGAFETGIEMLDTLGEYQRSRFPDDSVGPAYARNTLGACYMGQGRIEEARPLLTDTMIQLGSRGRVGDRMRMEAYLRMVEFYKSVGETRKAAHYRRLLKGLAPIS